MSQKQIFLEAFHPALDLIDDCIVVGFKVVKGIIDEEEKNKKPSTTILDQAMLLIGDRGKIAQKEFPIHDETPDRQILTIKSSKHLMYLSRVPEGGHRWDMDSIQRFIDAPELSGNAYKMSARFLEKYIDMSCVAYNKLLAVWCIATYFFPMFDAFPYLFFLGPKHAGKSQTLDCLALLAFNGYKIENITRAALGDMIDVNRATVLFDQSESIPKKMVPVLADSYKKGGGKRIIIERMKGVRVPRLFSTFGPKAFGSTKKLHFDLIDRCCMFKMRKTGKRLPSLIGTDAKAAVIRDAMYRFALLKYHEVQEAYRNLEADGTRIGEMWRPLEALLKTLKVSDKEIAEIKDVFDLGTSYTKYELTVQEEALFEILNHKIKKNSNSELANHQILKEVNKWLNKPDKIKSEWVGRKLSQYGLFVAKKREVHDSKKDTVYVFEKDMLDDAIKRYKPNLTNSSVKKRRKAA